MKKIFYALLAFTLGAACCACNDDNDPVVIASELEITPPQLDFEWNQSDSQLVTVKTDGSSWTAEPAADWITVTPADGSFTVSVTANTETSDRSSTVTVKADELTATLTVKQGFNREGSWYVEFVSENDATFYNISDNGKWVVGSYNGYTVVYNVETGETVYNTVGGEEGQPNNLDAYDITDDGTPVGSYLGLPAVYKNGAWQELDTDGHSMGAVYGTTPDGSVYAGFVGTGSDFKPVKWIDGRIQYLTCPETSYTGQEAYAGFVVKTMSADGLCVGADWTDQLGCYWSASGEVVYYGESTLIIQDDILMSDYGSQTMISPDGRYITTTMYDYSQQIMEPPFSVPTPIVYDRTTGQVAKLISDEGGHGNCTTPDGITFIGTAPIGTSELAMVYENGVFTPMQTWLKTNYGIKINHQGGEAVAISADGKTIVGFYLLEGNYVNYVIHLGERIK